MDSGNFTTLFDFETLFLLHNFPYAFDISIYLILQQLFIKKNPLFIYLGSRNGLGLNQT